MTTKPLLLTMDRIATPLGEGLLGVDSQGVLRVFEWIDHEARTLQLLRRQYPNVELQSGAAPQATSRAFEAYFAGELTALDGVATQTGGTEFQRRVWTALRTIPVGTTLSYQALATRIDSPRAVRAVGLANGKNLIGLVIPCHRVIGSDGTLTGYAGGLARKRWLLQHEGAVFRTAEKPQEPSDLQTLLAI